MLLKRAHVLMAELPAFMAELPAGQKEGSYTWYSAQVTFDVLTGYAPDGSPVVQEMHYAGSNNTPQLAITAAIAQAFSEVRRSTDEQVTLDYSVRIAAKPAAPVKP